MSIQRDFHPDFQAEAVCNFLKAAGNTDDLYSSEAEPRAEWQAEGYDFAAARYLTAAQPFPMRTFSTQSCNVYTQAGRLLNTVDLTDPVDHALELRISALLFLKPHIDPALLARINAAFQTTDLNDVDSVENDFRNQGVAYNDYQIVFAFELKRTADADFRTINISTFQQQMAGYTDVNGNPMYQLRWLDQITMACEASDYQLDDDHIVEGDPNDPLAALEEYEAALGQPCEGLTLIAHRVGTVFQIYEFKIEWLVRPIRIGRCRIMKTKVPVPFYRLRKEVLWCYVTTERDIRRYFETAIVDCIEYAAVSTAVLVIVTGGMGLSAAAAAFGSACQQCLEAKITQVVTCLFSKLKLVAEHDNWREGILPH